MFAMINGITIIALENEATIGLEMVWKFESALEIVSHQGENVEKLLY
jgi:hypothetical protein